MVDAKTLARFWSKVNVGADEDCWEWLAARTGHGYGNFVARKGKWIGAHKFAYELLVGPVPEGLQLDHLCRNPLCVNPEHLEPVTNQENTQRGLKGRMRTHCSQGHPFNEANTYIRKNGRRMCRVCSTERSTTWRRKERAGNVVRMEGCAGDKSNDRRSSR